MNFDDEFSHMEKDFENASKSIFRVGLFVVVVKILLIVAVLFCCVKGCNYVKEVGLKKIGSDIINGSQQ